MSYAIATLHEILANWFTGFKILQSDRICCEQSGGESYRTYELILSEQLSKFLFLAISSKDGPILGNAYPGR